MTQLPMIIGGLDIETTGLNYEKGDRIIEIALSVYQTDTRQNVYRYEQRFNPKVPINPDAERVHGISMSDLMGKPEFREHAGTVQSILAQCNYVIIHNAGFDAPFVLNELMLCGLALPPTVQVYCTMENARSVTPNGKLPALQELAWAMEVEYDVAKAHGALYDVDVMMACFWKGVDYGIYRLAAPQVAA